MNERKERSFGRASRLCFLLPMALATISLEGLFFRILTAWFLWVTSCKVKLASCLLLNPICSSSCFNVFMNKTTGVLLIWQAVFQSLRIFFSKNIFKIPLNSLKSTPTWAISRKFAASQPYSRWFLWVEKLYKDKIESKLPLIFWAQFSPSESFPYAYSYHGLFQRSRLWMEV